MTDTITTTENASRPRVRVFQCEFSGARVTLPLPPTAHVVGTESALDGRQYLVFAAIGDDAPLVPRSFQAVFANNPGFEVPADQDAHVVASFSHAMGGLGAVLELTRTAHDARP